MLIHCHLPKDKLYPGTFRSDEHYANSRVRKRLERIKDSVKEIGFMNPLSCGNDKDDGTYRVNRGNNCLRAAIELNIKSIPCIVYCREDQKHIPEGKQINKSELQKFHKSEIKQIAREEPKWFGVYPVDTWKYE
tara:strand:- start:198 stop:599 length:402 start_codon:yes stop_codon:yes gene_type:complete